MHPRLSFAMLLVACMCWGAAFPVIKALGQSWTASAPGMSTWAITASALAWRFLAAALVLALVLGAGLRRLTRREALQGAELSLLSALALALQMDSLAWTSASTSAFLGQGYAVLLPLWSAIATRRPPHALVLLAVALVVAGAGILAGVDGRGIGFGRGELEAVGSAVAFTMQILAVESPRYAGNHPWRMTTVSFACTGALMLIAALLLAPTAGAVAVPAADGGALACLAILVLLPTLGGTGLMFAFQGGVGAVVAGVVYCTLPIFAAAASLCAPGVLSGLLGIAYPDERLTGRLLLGGGLVAAAVVAAQLASRTTAREGSPTMTKETACAS